MTQFVDSSTPDSGDGSSSTSDVVKDEARNVGQAATQAGSRVASTAADQAKQVTQETTRQAQDLLSQGRSQATEQVRNSQAQAASSLSSLAEELRGMLDHDGEASDGPAHDLVRQATQRVDGLADWLQSHEPGDVLSELRRFAQRRPGAFLFGAAVAGVVAGRLTTGVVAAHRDDSPATPSVGPGSYPQTYEAPAVSETPAAYQTPAYETPALSETSSTYPPSVAVDMPAVPEAGPRPGAESDWAGPQRTDHEGGRL